MPGINQGVNAFLRPNTLPISENYNTRNLTSKDLSDGNAECHMELSSPSFAEHVKRQIYEIAYRFCLHISTTSSNFKLHILQLDFPPIGMEV